MQASSRGGDSFVRSDHETPSAFEHQTCLIKCTGLDQDTPSLSKAYRVGDAREDIVVVESWHEFHGVSRTANGKHAIDCSGPGIDLGATRGLGSGVGS